MITGFRGTFVISWTQTEVDGLSAAPKSALNVGALWRWTGDAVRVDGPGEPLLLDGAMGLADLKKRAARSVRRFMGATLGVAKKLVDVDPDDPLMNSGFVVTDGRQSFSATLVNTGDGNAPLLMFLDILPPQNVDLWVVQHTLDVVTADESESDQGGVICFTPGTRIATPEGPRLIETLCEGDHISTKDDGAQEILWIGHRRISGARLQALPGLRPVRLLRSALGQDRPDGDLIVSPDHRLLLKGRNAQLLFNTPEVLVRAVDLINDTSVFVDHALQEVTYIHLMLDRHQIVWANGVETESFHPAQTSLASISIDQRARLFERFPNLKRNAESYGDPVRRNLTRSETAILKYDGGAYAA